MMQTRNGWLVVLGAALALSASSNPVMAFTFSLFIQPLADAFGWSRSLISLGFTASVISMALAGPWAGRLFDRLGVRRPLLWGVVLYGVTLAAASLVRTPVAFVALYALLGMIGIVHGPVPFVKVISQWFDRRRGLALGLAMAGMSIGGVILPPFVGFLMAHGGWREAYRALGACVALVGWLAVFLWVREPDKPVMDDASAPAVIAGGMNTGAALRDRSFHIIAGWTFFMSMAINGTAAHVVPMLTSKGLTLDQALGLVGILAVASLLGRLGSGLLLDRIFAPFAASLIAVASVVGVAILWSGVSGPARIAAMLLFGFGIGAEIDVVGFLIGRYFGLRCFGQIFACAFVTIPLSAAAGAQLMGLSFDMTRSYDGALLGFACCLVLSILLPFGLGRYRYPAAALPSG